MPRHAGPCYRACLEDRGCLFGSARLEWCHCRLCDRRVKHLEGLILTMSLHGGCRWTGRVQWMRPPGWMPGTDVLPKTYVLSIVLTVFLGPPRVRFHWVNT